MKTVRFSGRCSAFARSLLPALLLVLSSPAGELQAQQHLVDFGSTWSFFRGRMAPSEPPTAWRELGFDDSEWESGPTGIGYGDGDDATILTDMQGNYLTVFLRQEFQVPNVAAITRLTLAVDYDDGYILFLNGIEVARSASMGAPGQEFTFDQPAAAGHEAGVVELSNISAVALPELLPGTNLLAVQVHNTPITSSDLSFNLRLTANDPTVDCPRSLACAVSTTAVTLSWSQPAPSDSIAVTRNGVPITGSPFPGTTTMVIDGNPGNFNNTYEVTARFGTFNCPVLSCTTGPQFTLIARGEDWRFFRGTQAPSEPPAAWRERLFDDSAWEIGPTGIGYGDNDDATILDDMQGNYISVFTRKTFVIPNLALISSLVLDVDYDDGFIAFLNGLEVARSANMGAPGQEFAFNQGVATGREAGTAELFDITPSLGSLRQGENVLAVQIHNNGINSSDLSFLPRLRANLCAAPSGLTCTYSAQLGGVAISWARLPFDSVSVTRNGVPIPGSPFPGSATSAVDLSPGSFDNVYAVSGSVGGSTCPPATCTVNCSARDPGALSCVLSLAGGITQAELNWVTPPGATGITIRREGALMATLTPGESSFLDPNVESMEPEDDTDYQVIFGFAGGETCTIACAASLCPETFTCEEAVVGGIVRTQLSWGNMVKQWESFSVLRNGVEIASGLPGSSTSYIDDTMELLPGQAHTYTLVPVAPPGGAVGTLCNRTCTISATVPELADYNAPAGGWDYFIGFENPGDRRYNPAAGERGNLDGSWIRALTAAGLPFDSWDGSAPLETGPAPDGAAPGGVAIETLAGLGPCGGNAGVLRVLDPGDPSAPGASLATAFPLAYDPPNNRLILLGFDTGVAGRNLLRDGVTFTARWRVNPNPPAYLAPGATGDGSPLSGGFGQVGIYFIDDGSIGGAGSSAALGFALQTGDLMQMSTNPLQQMQAAHITTFRSIWVTVQDPEGDNTYDITFYMNGQTTPFTIFGTQSNAALQAASASFGFTAGNFLVIGNPSGSNDGDFHIDYVGYKVGVHAPAATPCAPSGEGRFVRGDADSDGTINLTDAVRILNFLFTGGVAPTCLDAADADDSGTLAITDAIRILGWLFSGGVRPLPPSPSGGNYSPGDCGPDPTVDGLDCRVAANKCR
jgi:uncharacterized protein (DUF3820 family)